MTSRMGNQDAYYVLYLFRHVSFPQLRSIFMSHEIKFLPCRHASVSPIVSACQACEQDYFNLRAPLAIKIKMVWGKEYFQFDISQSGQGVLQQVSCRLMKPSFVSLWRTAWRTSHTNMVSNE